MTLIENTNLSLFLKIILYIYAKFLARFSRYLSINISSTNISIKNLYFCCFLISRIIVIKFCLFFSYLLNLLHSFQKLKYQMEYLFQLLNLIHLIILLCHLILINIKLINRVSFIYIIIPFIISVHYFGLNAFHTLYFIFFLQLLLHWAFWCFLIF